MKSMPGSCPARLPPRSRGRRLEPDQRRHAPGDAIAAERIEGLGLRVSAARLGMDRLQTERAEALARQPLQIALPAAAGIGCERSRGLRVALTERRAHFLAHFIMGRPDGWSQPGQQLIARTV